MESQEHLDVNKNFTGNDLERRHNKLRNSMAVKHFGESIVFAFSILHLNVVSCLFQLYLELTLPGLLAACQKHTKTYVLSLPEMI